MYFKNSTLSTLFNKAMCWHKVLNINYLNNITNFEFELKRNKYYTLES